MAYYNWGEQVSNSFMNMLAMNQQKKLEEKRDKFEQQRLNMAETQLGYAKQEMDSKLRADEQTYKYQQMLIDEATRKQKMDMENGGTLDMTNDGVDNGVFFNAADYERYLPLSYKNVTYNKFNPETGKIVPASEWLRQGEMDSLLRRYADQFSQEYDMYSDEKTRELERIKISQAGIGNSIEQQKLDMLKEDVASTNLNNAITTLSSNMSTLNDLFYVKNGVLWERNPASQETKDFWPSTSKQLKLSEHDLQSAITSVISSAAKKAQTPSTNGSLKTAWMKGYDVTKGGAINLSRALKKTKFSGNNRETVDMTENIIYAKDIVYDKNGYATIIDPATGKSYYVTKNGEYKKK